LTTLLHNRTRIGHEGPGFIHPISNPDSLQVLTAASGNEPSLKETTPLARYQFERMGYFCTAPDTSDAKLVFNRTVTLKDTWAKIQQKQPD
jgi:glutaminyl-tRNA synthetase